MKDPILILGGTGMLGHVLLRYFISEGLNVFATSRDVSGTLTFFPSFIADHFISENIDVAHPDRIKTVIEDLEPSIVINCIGAIKQLPVSNDPLAAIGINSLFPHQVAHLCRDAGIRMVHISTDCVFDGKKGMYTEDDVTAPEDLYGRTKLIGEVDYPGCVTLRTSIIGHELRSRHGLVEWFLGEPGPVNGYTHALYTGLPTIELARIMVYHVLPKHDMQGIYHVSSEPISKYQLLSLVAKEYGKRIEIKPYDKMIVDRSMISEKFRATTGYMPPSWPDLIKMMHEDYSLNLEYYKK